ncbi:hypothetical protein FDP41_003643 [Naegleria fowleri]|uniref:EGF-like domain-containing protein n=1 Tax=Naegleria fowleri TaxID=5763 RepID=A0A6A5BTG4_NAEFO|nr:uncharacterized protein FDP41_003643 [Naegleria fowleri]KAF0977651.1 hypothetical protein FDP41_003643 [Naegleria fowleri]
MATSAQLNSPNAIYVSKTGECYIADTLNHRIRKILLNGNIVTVVGNGNAGFDGEGTPATSAQLNSPSGIHISELGHIFIADTLNRRICKVDSNGTISTIGGHYFYGFNGDALSPFQTYLYTPTSVSGSNATGKVYFSDTTNNIVRVLEPYCQDGLAYDSATSTSVTDVLCNGFSKFSPNVCSSRGKCVATNTCSCSVGYTGNNCEFVTCGWSFLHISSSLFWKWYLFGCRQVLM